MYCKICGTSVSDGALYCRACISLDHPDPEAATSAPKSQGLVQRQFGADLNKRLKRPESSKEGTNLDDGGLDFDRQSKWWVQPPALAKDEAATSAATRAETEAKLSKPLGRRSGPLKSLVRFLIRFVKVLVVFLALALAGFLALRIGVEHKTGAQTVTELQGLSDRAVATVKALTAPRPAASGQPATGQPGQGGK